MGSRARRADARFVIDSIGVAPSASVMPRKKPRRGRPGPISRMRDGFALQSVVMLSTHRTVPEIWEVSRSTKPSVDPSWNPPVVFDATAVERSHAQWVAASYSTA